MSARDIQRIAGERGIKHLIHFTRASNLPSIMRYGLIPRSRFGELDSAPTVNDQLRLDGHQDSNSLSISLANSSMFYRYRKQDESVDWVVIGINPSVLWTKRCAFCRHNAADARISRQPLPALMTATAFSEMFMPIEGVESREEQKLKNEDPTDPQAEVLVFDGIEPTLFLGVVFNSNRASQQYAEYLGEVGGKVVGSSKSFFANRNYNRKF